MIGNTWWILFPIVVNPFRSYRAVSHCFVIGMKRKDVGENVSQLFVLASLSHMRDFPAGALVSLWRVGTRVSPCARAGLVSVSPKAHAVKRD